MRSILLLGAITFADDLHIVTTVAAWAKVLCMTNNPIGYEQIRFIDVLTVRIKTMQQTPYQTAVQVGRHSHSSRRLARTVQYNDLVLIWRAARSIPDKRIKMREEEQLLSISKKKFKVSLKAQATIAVPTRRRQLRCRNWRIRTQVKETKNANDQAFGSLCDHQTALVVTICLILLAQPVGVASTRTVRLAYEGWVMASGRQLYLGNIYPALFLSCQDLH